jgi:hypothetical protein
MSLNLIEYGLTIFLIITMFMLTVVAFVIGITFFIDLYKQIKELKKNDKW